ncbi:MAG: cytidine deaminase [Myxococcales bacterium]|nr:cytidine deaminase [Myxococcales bacterium]USN50757.1 MAG: cytidine deaminase [Myxococcales bacterium]
MDKAQLRKLLNAANEVRLKAYAPYSDYHVGCAILLRNSTIITGANIENASFGATICAERSALSTVVSAGLQKDIQALAIVTQSSPVAAPCGICRQVLSEFLSYDAPIILANDQGESTITSIGNLLPMAFSNKALIK